ncbi:MAG: helix-turn-helix transcriptional regulator [Bacilli bacterium]|nr:helix-turn-helix transcriptional regulator [Bacilli bacterium]
MAFNEQIQKLRKECGMTQNELAEKLFISYQAVSQWENGNTKPDIDLLPKLAEIFNVSIDELFGRKTVKCNLTNVEENTLYFVIATSDEIMGIMDLEELKKKQNEVKVTIEGDTLNVVSSSTVTIKGNVQGNVDANQDVNTSAIGGNVRAGCDINCANITGNASAGCDISCANISGNVAAGCELNCSDIRGNVSVGGNLTCEKIEADTVKAGGIIYCNKEIKANKIETNNTVESKNKTSKITIEM